jgi:hypothetical protein
VILPGGFGGRVAVWLVVCVALLLGVAGAAQARPQRAVCAGAVAAGAARCYAHVVTDAGGTPRATSAPTGYGPAQLHGAYALPATAAVAQTIAIVDAYDDPTISSDLNYYSSFYGLAPCTTANGCFEKLNQSGQPGPYPSKNAGWALEIALDVETAHEICQNCKVVLLEASSSSLADLETAVNTAARLGASEISNSYGGPEFSGEVTDTAYNHPGIAVTVSSGDNGYGLFGFPAASPGVVAVGGTTLNLAAGNAYGGESAWSGTGSGCSLYLPAQSWQTSDANWPLTGCGSRRGGADVAAAALPYRNRLFLHDVTQGSNGSCGTIMCNAGAGYDGPTGVGTPNTATSF